MYRFAAFFLGMLLVPVMQAQSHFTFTSGTGNNATLVIPQSASPTLAGAPLEAGDEIAVTTPAGLVVGAVVWPGSAGGNVSITVNGDDEVGTPTVIDGIRAGEALGFRVWDASANREYGSVTVSYSSAQAFYRTDGVYAVNAIYALASLSVSVPTAPAAPALTSPGDGQTNVSTAPTLAWGASSGATSYDVQLAATSDFASPLVNGSGVTSTTTSVTGLGYARVYYWRVRAVNGAGAGAWTVARSFTTVPAAPNAPALVSPADGATGIEASAPVLTWSAASGATSYEVQVATTGDFASPAVRLSGVTGTSATPTGLQALTTYLWRVRSVGPGGSGAWSAARSFTTAAPQAPNAPQLTSPASGATGVPVAPTLAWSTSSGATSYDVQLAATSDFASPLVNGSGVTSTTTSVTGLGYARVYYWRVRAVNAGGASTWSAPAMFTTAALQAPNAPALVSPAEGATGVGSGVTLAWATTETAVSYDVQVSDFGALVYDGTALVGTSVDVRGLRGHTTFYWRVRSVNAAGAGAWSAPRSFTTASTGVAVEDLGTPPETTLGSAYPNPARVRTTVPYTLAAPMSVHVEVVDALGRVVARLVDEAMQPAGRYAAVLEAAGLVPGVYVCRMQAGSVVQTRRLVLTADR